MDFRKLISTIEQIEKKQILKEGKDWDKDGKVEKPSQEYKGVKDNAIKKSMANKHKKESIDSNVSIAQYLLREFDLEEAEFKFSPEQEKWLGGANRQDPNIISRMPGPKPTIDYFKDPADQEIAKQLNFGRQNLNTLKRGLGMQQGDAQVFGNAPDSTAGVQGSTAATAAQPDGPDGNNAPVPDPTAGVQGSTAGNPAQGMPDGPDGNNAPSTAPAAVSSPVKPQPAPSRTELSGPAGGQYTIKKGDNLTKIAKANGTTIQAILAANPQIKNPNMIYAGAKLNLPNAAKPAQSTNPAQPKISAAAQQAIAGGQAAGMPDRVAADPESQTFIPDTPTKPSSNMSLIDRGRQALGIPSGGTSPTGQSTQPAAASGNAAQPKQSTQPKAKSASPKDVSDAFASIGAQESIINRLRTLSGL